jgi:hypothetical protein
LNASRSEVRGRASVNYSTALFACLSPSGLGIHVHA